jgi:anti-anti-sigma regulatory factor
MLMTVTLTAFQCGGARIRIHCRRLATVVTIQGDVDASNIDRVGEYARRFILASSSLVLDLSGVNSVPAEAISFICSYDEDCRAAGVDWTLIAGDAVTELMRGCDDEVVFPIARSVDEALHDFADASARRRQLLLPLIGKTA